MKIIKITLALIILLTPAVQGEEAIPYTTGFEQSEGFSVAALPQNGWTASSGSGLIQSATVNADFLALQIDADSAVDKTFDGTSMNEIWIDGWFRTEPGGAASDPANLGSASSLIIYTAAGVQCLDGDGSGSGEWVNTRFDVPNDWFRVTIHQYYTAQSWDCYINETLVASNLGFKNNSITALSGFQSTAAQENNSYLDSFSISSNPPLYQAIPLGIGTWKQYN